MRYILIFCFITLASAAAFGQFVQETSRFGKTFNQIDPAIKGVNLSSDYEDILAKLGKPGRVVNVDEIDQCTDSNVTVLEYDGLEIEIHADKDKKNATITSLVVSSPKWVLNSGVKIGQTRKKIESIYSGSNAPTDDPNELTFEVLEKYGPGGVDFLFENGKLVRIELKMTTC